MELTVGRAETMVLIRARRGRKIYILSDDQGLEIECKSSVLSRC